MSGYFGGKAYGSPRLVKQRQLNSQREEKVRQQASEAQREKELERSERDRKNRGDIFCWRNNMKICSGSEKMRNASRHLGENERQWKKSEQEHVQHFLHKILN